MSVNDIRAGVECIRWMKSDNEAAHVAEDRLHVDVLQAIAKGECDDPAACALEALSTLTVVFDRWFA